MIAYSPICVADTKIIFAHNFIAPLTVQKLWNLFFFKIKIWFLRNKGFQVELLVQFSIISFRLLIPFLVTGLFLYSPKTLENQYIEVLMIYTYLFAANILWVLSCFLSKIMNICDKHHHQSNGGDILPAKQPEHVRSTATHVFNVIRKTAENKKYESFSTIAITSVVIRNGKISW